MENHTTTSVHFLNHEMIEDHLLFSSLNNIFFNAVLCYETIDIDLQNISVEKLKAIDLRQTHRHLN